MLVIFYDGKCPLCVTEMKSLKLRDKDNQISLIDIYSHELNQKFPEININEAKGILHGIYQGKLLLGLSVTHRAWTIVGKGFWVAPLNWPVFKTVSHWVYLFFAKYRHPISSVLSKLFNLKEKQCTGVCFDDSTHDNNRS